MSSYIYNEEVAQDGEDNGGEDEAWCRFVLFSSFHVFVLNFVIIWAIIWSWSHDTFELLLYFICVINFSKKFGSCIWYFNWATASCTCVYLRRLVYHGRHACSNLACLEWPQSCRRPKAMKPVL
jgi:hypothetical protein